MKMENTQYDSIDSPITVVKQAILTFLEEMRKSKRMVENEIRDRTENVLSDFQSRDIAQISFNDIMNLNKNYRDNFLDYYRNIIHLRILGNASLLMRQAIEEGLSSPEIVQQELMKSLGDLQKQVDMISDLKEQLERSQQKVAEQDSVIKELSSGQELTSKDFEAFQEAIGERDQMIVNRDKLLQEKDDEIFNLQEGLSRMENQVNSLGSDLMNRSFEIEDLQEAISSRNEEISQLREQIKTNELAMGGIDDLKNELANAERKIQDLEQQVSTASGDLVVKLQQDLEVTRNQVLELRREIVEKNDHLHKLQVEREEMVVETKNSRENVIQLTQQLNEAKHLETSYAQITRELDERDTRIEDLQTKLNTAENNLNTTKEQLSAFEGKVSVSAEEQARINSETEQVRKKLDEYTKQFDYLKTLIKDDAKIKILFYLDAIKEEIRIDDLAQGVGIPKSALNKLIVELSHNGKIITRRDGRQIYVGRSNEQPIPFSIDLN